MSLGRLLKPFHRLFRRLELECVEFGIFSSMALLMHALHFTVYCNQIVVAVADVTGDGRLPNVLLTTFVCITKLGTFGS